MFKQGRTGTRHDRNRAGTGQDRAGQDRTGWDGAGQDRAGQDRTGLGLDKKSELLNSL